MPACEETVARRNDLAVKIDADIVRDARTIASYRGTSLAEYLSEKLRGPVARDLETLRRELDKRTDERERN